MVKVSLASDWKSLPPPITSDPGHSSGHSPTPPSPNPKEGNTGKVDQATNTIDSPTDDSEDSDRSFTTSNNSSRFLLPITESEDEYTDTDTASYVSSQSGSVSAVESEPTTQPPVKRKLVKSRSAPSFPVPKIVVEDPAGKTTKIDAFGLLSLPDKAKHWRKKAEESRGEGALLNKESGSASRKNNFLREVAMMEAGHLLFNSKFDSRKQKGYYNVDGSGSNSAHKRRGLYGRHGSGRHGYGSSRRHRYGSSRLHGHRSSRLYGHGSSRLHGHGSSRLSNALHRDAHGSHGLAVRHAAPHSPLRKHGKYGSTGGFRLNNRVRRRLRG